jgi:hypothetical protein
MGDPEDGRQALGLRPLADTRGTEKKEILTQRPSSEDLRKTYV